MRKRPFTTTVQPPTIKVKRRPAARGFFKRLNAVTRGRNQRVAAAAAAEDLEAADHSSRISRGLTIIFGVHILAIGLYFFHSNFLSKRTDDPGSGSIATRTEPKTPASPLIQPQDRPEMIARGDTYATIAARVGVDEAELRAANNNCAITPGNKLIVPSKRIKAALPPEVEALRQPATPAQPRADEGLVEVNPNPGTPAGQPVLVKPQIKREETPPRAIPVRQGTVGRSYTVRPGDSLWGIAKRMKVDQAALMKANGISDPKKLKAGMTLSVPN